MSSGEPQRKIFIWMDEVREVHVSLAHQTEEELADSYDLSPASLVLKELPFRFSEAEKSEEILGRYYKALEGLLALPEMETILELIMETMVREGIELAGHMPKKKESVN